MILRPRLEPLGHIVRRGLELGDVQRLEPFALAVEDADVRPIELVRGARQEVAAPFPDIHQLMGAKCTASTNVSASASRAMATARGMSLIVPSALEAAPIASSSAAMIVQATVQVVPIELAGLRNHPDLKDGDAPLALEGAPGIDVGVMVELGDDDRVAVPERSSQGPGQVERERGHVETEGDLGGRGVEKIGEGLRADARAASVSALVGNAQWVLALWWTR